MPGFARDSKTDVEAEDVLSSIDHEEQNAGYQAAFTRLAASEPPKFDPVAYVPDTKVFLRSELSRLAKTDPKVTGLLETASQSTPLFAAILGGM